MSDFAILLAGGVSVPLYPTLAPGTIRQILEHSESKLLFVGKLDGWEHMQPGVPAGLPCISHPLSPEEAKKSYPRWDEIIATARHSRVSRCVPATSSRRSCIPRAPPAHRRA